MNSRGFYYINFEKQEIEFHEGYYFNELSLAICTPDGVVAENGKLLSLWVHSETDSMEFVLHQLLAMRLGMVIQEMVKYRDMLEENDGEVDDEETVRHRNAMISLRDDIEFIDRCLTAEL